MKNSLLEAIQALKERNATTRKGEEIDFSNVEYRIKAGKRFPPFQADMLIYAIKQAGLSVQRSLIKITIGEKYAWQIKKMTDDQIKSIYPSLSGSQKTVVRQCRRS